MMLMREQTLKKVASHLPDGIRSLLKSLYHRNRHWAHPALRGFGTVQDLYYWVADSNLDTLLLLQNYFSALYPELNTATEGSVTLYDKGGMSLGNKSFSVNHCGSAKFRVSSLREEFGVPRDSNYGSLEVNLAIPRAVLAHIQGQQKSCYFWDRFYISYVNSKGQPCFVHGIDKTNIYREGKSNPIDWYKANNGHQWAPEIPVDIDNYKKLNVIMINRASRSTDVTLTLSDSQDNSLSWSTKIPSKGVHRFELSEENTAGLLPKEIRMRVQGMATQWGRPVVFKEFHNGAISAMHC